MSQPSSRLVAVVAGVAFAAGLVASPSILSQPEQPEMDPEVAAAWAKAITPDEHHAALEPLIGTWDARVEFRMAPGAEMMESEGTVTREWAMDGRFVIERVEGATPGQPGLFKGMGLLGYNTVEGVYESVWIENMATYMSFAEGEVEPGEKMVFTGEMLDPVTGQHINTRYVMDISDPDRHVSTGYAVGPDGEEYVNFEGVMTRSR